MNTSLLIWQAIPGMAAFAYFRWIFNKWSIQFYRDRGGRFQFQIDLPLIHIGNTLLRKQAFDGYGGFMGLPVTTGKILFWDLGV